MATFSGGCHGRVVARVPHRGGASFLTLLHPPHRRAGGDSPAQPLHPAGRAAGLRDRQPRPADGAGTVPRSRPRPGLCQPPAAGAGEEGMHRAQALAGGQAPDRADADAERPEALGRHERAVATGHREAARRTAGGTPGQAREGAGDGREAARRATGKARALHPAAAPARRRATSSKVRRASIPRTTRSSSTSTRPTTSSRRPAGRKARTASAPRTARSSSSSTRPRSTSRARRRRRSSSRPPRRPASTSSSSR